MAAMPCQHLGEALATDCFLVREQFGKPVASFSSCRTAW
jgi:hypothetical protein